MKRLLLVLLINTIATICLAQSPSNDEMVFTETDTITGSIYTANRLKDFMENKAYDQAIALFSAAQQAKIKTFREDKDIFSFWCAAWTFDTAKYERYIAKIKEGKAPFVFENGEWKIDEK